MPFGSRRQHGLDRSGNIILVQAGPIQIGQVPYVDGPLLAR